MATQKLLDSLSPVWFRATDITVTRGEGIYLFDNSGNRYIDCTSGIGVVSTGHCHPRVVRAIQEQAGKLLFGQINVVYHDVIFDLISELQTVVQDQLNQYFFSNSGAEAVEAAVKLAKHASGKPNVIVFQGGYHGRTGRFFTIEYEQIVPDILTFAKEISSGVPISGIVYRKELAEKWIVGSHGGTYGGNPVACAAALETIRVIKEEGLVQNTAKRGRQLMDGLEIFKQRFPFIGEVRGKGLMIAVEFGESGKPDTERTKKTITACQDQNLLLLTCGFRKNIIRWIPPLVISEEEVDEVLEIFEEALKQAD